MAHVTKCISFLAMGFSLGYAVLFALSVVFLVPRYVSGEIADFLLSVLIETEPEFRVLAYYPLALFWMALPLSSIALRAFSWAAFFASTKANRLDELIRVGGAALFALSLVAAILVVRELIIYHSLAVTLSALLRALSNLIVFSWHHVDPAFIVHWGGLFAWRQGFSLVSFSLEIHYWSLSAFWRPVDMLICDCSFH